jgi:L-serine dehydratase
LAEVVLVNSMATTGDGHGTEVAVAAGLLGLRPTDADTTDALGLAEQVGLDLDFQRFPSLDDAHPNTIYLRLRRGELSLRVKIVSIGGGNYELDCGASAPVEGVSTPEQMHAW